MSNSTLIRIDFRLLHGQVVTGWVKKLGAKKVIIIDDKVKNDKYLHMVFEMAKPQGIKLQFLTCAEAGEQWQANKIGVNNKESVIILFKNVQTAWEAYHAGMKFDKMQVGTTEGGSGKVNVNSTFYLSNEDAITLNDLSEQGVGVVFQSVAEAKSMDWKDIHTKYFQFV